MLTSLDAPITLPEIAANLAIEALAIEASGEPPTLRDAFGRACYPLVSAASIVASAAAIGRRLHEPLVITDEDGDLHTCTLGAFIVDNREAVDLVAEVVALAPGASTWGGGGAASWFSIERVAVRP